MTIDAKPYFVTNGPKFPAPKWLQYMVRMNVPVVFPFKKKGEVVTGFRWVRYYGHSN